MLPLAVRKFRRSIARATAARRIVSEPRASGYVDLGQPCEDRQAILKKAKQCGAKSARIVDAQEELCRDFAFPRPAVAGQVRRRLPAGHVDRPAADLEGLPAGRPRSRGRRLRPRRHRQGQRSVPLSTRGRGPRSGGQGDRPLADREVSPAVPRPHRDDRLLRAEEDSGQGLGRRSRTARDENCLHISYEAGKLEDLTVNGVELVEFGMTVSPQKAPDKIETVTIGSSRACRSRQRPAANGPWRWCRN